MMSHDLNPLPNHRMQATAGWAALSYQVRYSPAAPDAERWADEDPK